MTNPKHLRLAGNSPEVRRAADMARRLFPGLRKLLGDNPRIWREVAWTLQRLAADLDDDDTTIAEMFKQADEKEAKIAAMPRRDLPITDKYRDSRKQDRLVSRLVGRLDDGALRQFARTFWKEAFIARREPLLWWMPGELKDLLSEIPKEHRRITAMGRKR